MTKTESFKDSEDLVPVFVYGTLRYGEGNFHWCADAVKAVEKDCTASGAIYFAWTGKSTYPVARFDERGTILGDILWFDRYDPLYDRVVEMEQGAGYISVPVKVTAPDGAVYVCDAFHYCRTPQGEKITSGDWASEVSYQ